MRRIIVGAISFALFFTQFPVMGGPNVNAVGTIGYTKVWETNPEEKLNFTPTIADDGSIYGISGSDLISGSGPSKLVRVDEGKITWKSDEDLQGLPMNFWPIILNENLIIAAGGVDSPDSKSKPKETNMLFVCYTRDGHKVWDRTFKLTMAIPAYQFHDGNIWLVYSDVLRIIDPKTGEIKNEIDLAQLKQSNLVAINEEGDDEGEGDETEFEMNVITFTKDTMLLYQLNQIRSFKIGDDFELKLDWQKKFDNNSLGMIMNMFMALQANTEVFLVSESESEVKCYDTATGKENWTLELDSLGFALIFYNTTNLIMLGLTGVSGYNVVDKKLLWQKPSVYYPIAMNQDYFFSGSIAKLDKASAVDIIDMKTGEKVSQIMESEVTAASISSSDIYLVSPNKISKFTKCDPCICDVDATWKTNGKTSIDSEICPLETKEFELNLTNTAQKSYVDCNLRSESNKISFSASTVKLETGGSETIIVNYSAGINEPDKSDVIIKAAFSCSKEIELKLSLKKAGSCEEVLKKKYSLSGSQFYLFGNVLVSPDIKRTGLFNVEFNGFKGINIDDGKKVWFLGKDQLGNTDEMNIEERDGNLMICKGFTEDDQMFWAGIDALSGKIAWKRTGGQPFIMDKIFNAVCSNDEVEAAEIDLFDIKTGKNVISKVNLPCEDELALMCRLGDKYIIQDYDAEEKICSDASGKIFWQKKIRICNNWSTFKLNELYLEKPSSEKEEDLRNQFLTFKLSKVDTLTLKEAWSTEIAGNPSILMEGNGKVWVSSTGGIYCFDSNNGKLVWHEGDDKFGWNDPVIVNNTFCVERYIRDKTKEEKEPIKFIVVDPKDGKHIFEKDVKNFASFTQKDDLFYVSDLYYDEKDEKSDVHCFKIDGWKLLWTITGKGKPVDCGSKMFIKSRNGDNAWFEDGKLIGQFDVGSDKDDPLDFLLGKPGVNWFADTVYIGKGASLWAVDAKTSKLLWKYIGENSYDQSKIITGNTDWLEGDYVSTPCSLGNKVFLSEKGMLVVYETLK